MIQPRPRGPSLLLLGAASGLSPFGVTITVPLLAVIAREMNAGFTEVQFIISAYLFGLAAAQPFNGYLCDHFGRRPVLLTGFAVFIVSSFLAAYAASLEQLIVLRFFQAAGVSVGTVASRAVVRDTRDAKSATEALSYIAAFMGFAPVMAPIFGGWLGAEAGYEAVFIATGVMGLIFFVWIWFGLPETLNPENARPHWRQWASNYTRLLGSLPFIGYTMVFGFVQGCFFAFLAVGAEIFEREFGMNARDFGLLWGLMAVTYVTGAMVSGRMYRRFSMAKVMTFSVLTVLFGGWLALGLVYFLGVSQWTLLVPMGVLMAVSGAVTPGALAGAVNLYPAMAGTASGLSSAMGIVIGGLFTVLGGMVYHGDYLPVAGLIALSATLTALSWGLVWLTTKTGSIGNEAPAP